MRLGIDERGVTELVGIAETVSGLNKVAFGLMLDHGEDAEPLVPYPADDDLAEPARAALEDLAEVESRRLGRDGIPGIWRSLARNRHYIVAAWEKYHVLFDGPGLDPAGKLAVGLGVSVTNGCRYFIRYFHDALKHAGWSDGQVLEIFGVVDFYNGFNTLATGMQIESDIRPPAGDK
jgi:alkylhydroperoxidase/carboxymuconolactone decarboxylase family protein YurZ